MRFPVSRSSPCTERQLIKASRLADVYGGQAYHDLDRFLDHRPMDMVAIGSPSARHADDGMAAARRGLHVLVEKPLDVSTARADALIAETTRAGVQLGVFFQDRLKPDVVQVKSTLDAGTLGKLLLVSGRVKWYRPPECLPRRAAARRQGARRRRRADQSGDPHARSAALCHRANRARPYSGRNVAPRHRSRRHRRRDAGVRERCVGVVRSVDRCVSRLRPAGRDHWGLWNGDHRARPDFRRRSPAWICRWRFRAGRHSRCVGVQRRVTPGRRRCPASARRRGFHPGDSEWRASCV